MTHDFLNPDGLEHNEITTRHTYLREDCGHNDPSMSPSSRSGRGAMTLTPAPNGAEAILPVRSARADEDKTVSSSARGTRTQCLSSKELAFDPSAKRLLKMTDSCARGRAAGPRGCPSPFWMSPGVQGVVYSRVFRSYYLWLHTPLSWQPPLGGL